MNLFFKKCTFFYCLQISCCYCTQNENSIKGNHFCETSFQLQVAKNETGPHDQICQSQRTRIDAGECDGSSFKDWTSLAIVFLGIFLLGIGVSFYFSFGIPFVDDNTERGNR